MIKYFYICILFIISSTFLFAMNRENDKLEEDKGFKVDRQYKNYEKAMKWYLKAAEQNEPLAQLNIGSMYFHGYGIEPNYEEAIKWYLKVGNNEKVMEVYEKYKQTINKYCEN